MPGRKLLPLLVLVLAAAGLMIWQERNGPVRPANFLNASFYRLSATVGSVSSRAGDFFVNLATGAEDVRALEKKIAELEWERDSLASLRAENERLRTMLGLKDSEPRHIASANVITRGAKRWINTFVVDAGSSEGVRKDMAVVSPDGLAGKVMRVEGGHSTVLLVNDVRFAAAVRFEDSRGEALLSGTGGNGCILKYFPYDMPVKKGDVLVTSGLDGIFPAGIKAGHVAGVGPEEGLFRSVSVVPYVDTRRLEEVAILAR